MDTGVNDFVITPKMVDDFIAAHPDENFKGIVLNYPNNPTGVTYVEDEIKALADCFHRHNLWVVSDEIYSELTYGSDHVSIAKFIPDEVILINGLSKSHAMTGWRIGFLFASKEMTAQLKKVHQYYVTAATTIAQKAGVEASPTESMMRNQCGKNTKLGVISFIKRCRSSVSKSHVLPEPFISSRKFQLALNKTRWHSVKT